MLIPLLWRLLGDVGGLLGTAPGGDALSLTEFGFGVHGREPLE
jgi:hypothetical protein